MRTAEGRKKKKKEWKWELTFGKDEVQRWCLRMKDGMRKWGGVKRWEQWRLGVFVVVTHSEPAAMSRYEVSAVSTPTGMTMLMTFSADQFLFYWVQRMGVQNTEACQPQQSLQTSKCIHKAWTCRWEQEEDRQRDRNKNKINLLGIISRINSWSVQ